MTELKNQEEANKQVDQSLALVKEVFGTDLLGVYRYGSSVVGGLQKFSDIDLFVVSNRATTDEEKAEIINKMLTISNVDPTKEGRHIELTVVVKSDINPWKYPPSFDLQFGDWLRPDFEKGNINPWETKVKPDLAIVLTQILLASKTLFGADPKELLAAVPYKDFMTATVAEVDTLAQDLDWDTRNVLLTYARILSTVETDAIRSKPAAAEWVTNELPAEYKSVMQRAYKICVGEEPEHWEDLTKLVKPCADFMIEKIKEKASEIQSTDTSNRSIKLA